MDTDTKGGPEAARAAAVRLRAIAEGGPIGEEPPELFRYADLAASTIVAASQGRYTHEQQKQLADSLLEALTVLKFGSLLGGDSGAATAAREQVRRTVELFEMAIELAGE
jgi:hypothetical protein